MIYFKIDWAPNEIFFKIGPLAIHWYSIMFIVAFTLGYYIIKKIFINEAPTSKDSAMTREPGKA